MVRRPLRSAPAADPHPKRVEEICWSHRAPRHDDGAGDSCSGREESRSRLSPFLSEPSASPPKRRTCAGPCEPSRRLMTWGPPGRALPDRPLARRLPSRVHDATNFIADAGGMPAPQIILVSLCLADECHRPNCQRAEEPIRLIAPAGLVPMGGCSLARHRANRLALPTSPSTDAIGRCRLPHGNSPRPSSGSLVC
jgi:hypothetical protein